MTRPTSTRLSRPANALERGKRIVAVEPEVAGEVVPRAERDDDERQVALDGDLCNRRERAVAARHAEGRVRVPRASAAASSSSASTCVLIPSRSASLRSSTRSGRRLPDRGLMTRKPLMALASSVPTRKEPQWN